MNIRSTTPQSRSFAAGKFSVLQKRHSSPLQSWYKGIGSSQVIPLIREHVASLEMRVKKFGRIDALRTLPGMIRHLIFLGGFSFLTILSAFKLTGGLDLGPTVGFGVLGLLAGLFSWGLITDLVDLAREEPVFYPQNESKELRFEEARLLFRVFRNYPRVRQHAERDAVYGEALQKIDTALLDFIRFETFDTKAFETIDELFASTLGERDLRHLCDRYPPWWD